MSNDDGEPVFKSYIRIDRHEVIYALDPQRIDEGEKLIYSFSSKPSDEPISWLMWDGSLAEDEEYEFVKTRNVNADVEYADWKWAAYKVKLYPVGFKGDEDACVGAVTWYWGMGAASGFTNQLYSVYSAYTSTLKRVVTSCNGVVYDAGEGAASFSTSAEVLVSARQSKISLWTELNSGLMVPRCQREKKVFIL